MILRSFWRSFSAWSFNNIFKGEFLMKTRFFVLLSLLIIILSSCASAASGGIEVTNATVFLPVSASMSNMSNVDNSNNMNGMSMSASLAGYFQIKNNSSRDDRLLSVSCDFADAMMHETKMNGDVASMVEMPYVEVPAGATVEFKTGGMHIMFMNPSRELKIGDTVSLNLQFENAGTVTVTATVMGH
jgi:copper(I)-binding protein